MFDLSRRVALVTGAGQNTGAGIARALASRGAAVAVNDLHAERAAAVADEIVASGGKTAAVAFDVTDLGAVAHGVSEVESALGSIDILVNNAGIPEGMAMARFRDATPEQWRRFVDLNLYGVMNCAKATVDGMCARGFGRVVTISSGAAQTGLDIGLSAYAAGKAGAIAFMRHLAIEVARQGVTANSLALGLMNHAARGDLLKRIESTVPVGRAGTPEDIGAAVVFLASDEAAWITGQTIGINGGTITT